MTPEPGAVLAAARERALLVACSLCGALAHQPCQPLGIIFLDGQLERQPHHTRVLAATPTTKAASADTETARETHPE